MVTKLSFSEYLESKEQLIEAANSIPKQTKQYIVRRYCKLPVEGDVFEDKEHVALKPKQSIIVEWLYADRENPTPLSVKFANTDGISPDDDFQASWKQTKFSSWLSKNTSEKND